MHIEAAGYDVKHGENWIAFSLIYFRLNSALNASIIHGLLKHLNVFIYKAVNEGHISLDIDILV